MIDFKNCTFIKLKKVDNSSANSATTLFVPDEEIIGCYKGIRDYIIFTNKRIMSVNVQGITGKKKDFTSIPYSKIQVFSVETSGTFDIDSELEIYISSIGKIKFEFTGNSDIIQIGQIIGAYSL